MFSSVLWGDFELRILRVGNYYMFLALAGSRLSIGQFIIYISYILMFWYPTLCSSGSFFDEFLITLCILKPPEVFVGLYSSDNTPDMLMVFKRWLLSISCPSAVSTLVHFVYSWIGILTWKLILLSFTISRFVLSSWRTSLGLLAFTSLYCCYADVLRLPACSPPGELGWIVDFIVTVTGLPGLAMSSMSLEARLLYKVYL